VDENPAPAFPPPPTGWSATQPPPPPPPGWSGQWNAVPAPPMTPAQRGKAWDTVSFGFGGGALYLGFGGLLCAGLAWLLWKAPITTTHTGFQGTVDRTVGGFVLDLCALGFAMGAIAGGAMGGIAGLLGLITRKVSLAALSIVGLAVAVSSFGLGWYILAGISSWHR